MLGNHVIAGEKWGSSKMNSRFAARGGMKIAGTGFRKRAAQDRMERQKSR
jgi:hypothetical protein